jgi:hypothetical protein
MGGTEVLELRLFPPEFAVGLREGMHPCLGDFKDHDLIPHPQRCFLAAGTAL